MTEVLPARGRVYLAGVAVAGLLCLLPAVPLSMRAGYGPDVSWRAVASLAVLYACCERLARSRQLGAPHSGGTFHPVLLAAAFLLPPSAAALVALPGALLTPVEQRPFLARRIWRAGQLALAVWAASRVHRAAGGRETIADGDVPEALSAVGASVLVFCLVLTLLDRGILVFAGGLPLRPGGRTARRTTRRRARQTTWWRLFLRSLAPVTVHGLAGLMTALLWRSPHGPVAALLVLPPIYVSWWAFAQYHRERAAHQATIRALVQAVDIKDGYTRGHSERVGQASTMIARELGMDDERTEVLRFAGILHDVGKLGVPTRLLTKDGPLTPEERRVIETDGSPVKERCRAPERSPATDRGSVRPRRSPPPGHWRTRCSARPAGDPATTAWPRPAPWSSPPPCSAACRTSAAGTDPPATGWPAGASPSGSSPCVSSPCTAGGRSTTGVAPPTRCCCSSPCRCPPCATPCSPPRWPAPAPAGPSRRYCVTN
ncbi:HD-GYP domain-containing protein [Streptomyces sp. KMM 9044]|uniref:HD-GYP domain-containing protein n=1 Tax=Streptomyces sp. KMM 9044 TaxID=2744474 RepID=UPI002150EA23|nr:HD domain-containing phosphohydrolase [Streptomyces sp. KMM 9044]WAX81838.1 HD domain-containing protein [Streptomyces sp. KMM 9044]